MECEHGTYQDIAGSTACIPCINRTVTSGTGQSICLPCEAGSAFDETSKTCKKCEGGRQARANALACKFCERGYFSSPDRRGCEACSSGKYGVDIKNDRHSEATACVPCPNGTYNNGEGGADSSVCTKCPRGTFGTKVGAKSSSDCKECPSGFFASNLGSTNCSVCKFGTLCERPSTAVPIPCNSDIWCDGKEQIVRPLVKTFPNATAANGATVTIELDSSAFVSAISKQGNKSLPRIAYAVSEVIIERAVTKETIDVPEEATKLKALVTVSIPPTGGIVREVISGLNLGTEYYFRMRGNTSNGVESQPGPWSDAVSILCPEGAYCGHGKGYGVPANKVIAEAGYFRINWGEDESNLTFVRCPTTIHCEGGVDGREGCRNGTTGPLCELCLPNYSKAGQSLCRPCATGYVQLVYIGAGISASVMGLGTLCLLTLRNKGKASSLPMGVLKSGLRYFQLAALAGSFPLKWPPHLTPLFGFMNAASSMAGDILSVECTLGTDFAANAQLTFAFPAAVVALVAVFWVVRDLIKSRMPWNEKVGISL